jgi:hypothetical protein
MTAVAQYLIAAVLGVAVVGAMEVVRRWDTARTARALRQLERGL